MDVGLISWPVSGKQKTFLTFLPSPFGPCFIYTVLGWNWLISKLCNHLWISLDSSQIYWHKSNKGGEVSWKIGYRNQCAFFATEIHLQPSNSPNYILCHLVCLYGISRWFWCMHRAAGCFCHQLHCMWRDICAIAGPFTAVDQLIHVVNGL